MAHLWKEILYLFFQTHLGSFVGRNFTHRGEDSQLNTPSFIRIAVQPLELFRSEDVLQSLNKNTKWATIHNHIDNSMKSWLVTRDPCNGLLQFPYNWVVSSPICPKQPVFSITKDVWILDHTHMGSLENTNPGPFLPTVSVWEFLSGICGWKGKSPGYLPRVCGQNNKKKHAKLKVLAKVWSYACYRYASRLKDILATDS